MCYVYLLLAELSSGLSLQQISDIHHCLCFTRASVLILGACVTQLPNSGQRQSTAEQPEDVYAKLFF